MSQANIEIARQAVAWANAGDLEAVAELYHPDAEARDLQPYASGTPEVMIGRAAIVAVWEQWLEALDDWRIEIHELIDADPWVVSDTHWRATGKGSEVPIDSAICGGPRIQGRQGRPLALRLPRRCSRPRSLGCVGAGDRVRLATRFPPLARAVAASVRPAAPGLTLAAGPCSADRAHRLRGVVARRLRRPEGRCRFQCRGAAQAGLRDGWRQPSARRAFSTTLMQPAR